MPLDPRTPVLVGVGQYLHRAQGLDDALEPVDLMAEARVRPPPTPASAVSPPSTRCGSSARCRGGTATRRGCIAERLGLDAARAGLHDGGRQHARRRWSTAPRSRCRRRLDLAILAGGEAWRTRMRARKAGRHLDWAKAPEDQPPVLIGEELDDEPPGRDRARASSCRCRSTRCSRPRCGPPPGASPDEHLGAIAELWARFSAVAADNPYAWIRDAKTRRGDPHAVAPSNRMIGLAVPQVHELQQRRRHGARRSIMCSVEKARALGVPEDRWVFPHAGTDCHEHQFVSNRDTFARDAGHRLGGGRALELAGIGIDDVDVVDLYSCFPSAVQLGAAALGLDLDRQLTRTGGLAFAGGPWNNYVMHAIATVMQRPARPPGRDAAWCGPTAATPPSTPSACTRPSRRPAAFRHESPAGRDRRAAPAASWPSRPTPPGPATIEAYTVMHARDGAPGAGDRHVPAGRRPPGVGHLGRRRRHARRCSRASGSAPRPRSPTTGRFGSSDSATGTACHSVRRRVGMRCWSAVSSDQAIPPRPTTATPASPPAPSATHSGSRATSWCPPTAGASCSAAARAAPTR